MAVPGLPVLVHWPQQDAERRAASAARQPCLLVLEPGARIPRVGALEDWIVRTDDERDVAARLHGLTQRADAPEPPAWSSWSGLPAQRSDPDEEGE